VSDPNPSPPTASPADPAKALLLCKHAEELSRHCLIAIRNGATERMLNLQARKHVVVQALAATLRSLDLDQFPDLCRAANAFRESLRTEAGALADAAKKLQNDLLTLAAAQQRLANARRYDIAAPPAPRKNGGQFSASG
jgi:hypothetical protein